MIKRTLSTVGLWTVVFGAIYCFGLLGGVVLLALLTLLAQYEFQELLGKSGLPPWRILPLALGIALVLAAGSVLNWRAEACLILFLFLFGPIALVAGALFSVKNPAALNRLGGSVLALAYVPGMMLYYAMIAEKFGSIVPAVWVIAVAKFTDVGGYLVGSMVGRHKLAPSISPGKTWEGVAGGLLLAALVAYLPVQFAPQYFPGWLTPLLAVGLAFPIGIAAITSDLSESAFKRRAGVKDSGNCIPGIGGALDLADSLLLAGPVAFYLFMLVRR